MQFSPAPKSSPSSVLFHVFRTGTKQSNPSETAKTDTGPAPVAAAVAVPPAAVDTAKKAGAAKRARPAPKAAAAAVPAATAAAAAAPAEEAAEAPVPPQAAKKPRVSNAKKAAPVAVAAVPAAPAVVATAEAADATANDIVMGEPATTADKENAKSEEEVVEIKEEGAAGFSRRGAAPKTYKETGNGGVRATKKDRVVIVEEGVSASEGEALEATNEVKGIRRRYVSIFPRSADMLGLADL